MHFIYIYIVIPISKNSTRHVSPNQWCIHKCTPVGEGECVPGIIGAGILHPGMSTPKTKFVCPCCRYAGYGSDTLFVRVVGMQGMVVTRCLSVLSVCRDGLFLVVG